MNAFVVTGIGTGIGKTFCSAVLCEALQADYWKPIQAGDLDALDSDFVAQNTSNSTVYPARFLLNTPCSPHEAARIDGITIHEEDLELPTFQKQTIIEGAGGLLVPINEDGLTYLDVFQHWGLPVYVIIQHYLGSINHTLLTLNALYSREIPIAGIIINGERNEASERVFKTHFPNLPMSYIPFLKEITPNTIHEIAQAWNAQQH